MRIIYNGVDLGAIESHLINTESVYDDAGLTYLYSRVNILVRAVVNGQASVVDQSLPAGGQYPPPGPVISYQMEGRSGELASGNNNVIRPDPQNPVHITSGTSVPSSTGIDRRIPSRLRSIRIEPTPPVETHFAIRHRLSTPRGKLFVFSGPGMESGTPESGEKDPPGQNALLMFESPVEGRPCDCKNGPYPKVLSIQAALGDANTFIVDWSCETFINEGLENGVNPTGALLSNTFSQTHTIDDAGFTTMLTQGTAIFRTDLVHSLPHTPDKSRPFLFIPIPQGFVRENIIVRGREDVTGVDYSFQDRQVPVNFASGPYALAAKISATHRQAISTTNLLEGALSAYQGVLGLKANRNFANLDREERNESRSLERMLSRAIRRALRPRRGAAGGSRTPPPATG